MSRIRMVFGVLALLSTSVFMACVNSSGSGDEAAESADRLANANAANGKHRPPHPPSCSTTNECNDKCPPDSQGCACVELPMGGKGCVATCDVDDDCPIAPSDLPPLHCHEGICVPPPPPPPPN